MDGSEDVPTRTRWPRPPCIAPTPSGTRWDERSADDVCAAFLLNRELFERGQNTAFEGEVSGVISAGVFVRFRGELADVYEGFFPARRMPGERFEINDVESALVGLRSGNRVGIGARSRSGSIRWRRRGGG